MPKYGILWIFSVMVPIRQRKKAISCLNRLFCGKNGQKRKGEGGMIKGCQREIIVMKTQESKLFESAYFVLRRQNKIPEKCDMVAEANRLIGGRASAPCTPKRSGRGRLLLFLTGVLLGCGVGLLLGMLF
jgi:hypothetical protein